MKQALIKFKELKISKSQLKEETGEDLFNVDCPNPVVVNSRDLIKIIQHYIEKNISISQLIDWVNVVWFTELYELSAKESDSMVSVLDVLETLDEDDVTVSEEDFLKMIDALLNNITYY